MVAAGTGADVVHQGRAASAVLYRYVSGMPTVGYEWAYGDGSRRRLHPHHDDQTCVFVSTTTERMKQLRRDGAEAAFAALLKTVDAGFAERVHDADDNGRLHGWGGVPGFVRRAGGPVGTVGDAGHFKDPITTHGMTDGMRDAELLTFAVLSALDGRPEAEGTRSVRVDAGPAIGTALTPQRRSPVTPGTSRGSRRSRQVRLGGERRGRPSPGAAGPAGLVPGLRPGSPPSRPGVGFGDTRGSGRTAQTHRVGDSRPIAFGESR